MITAKLKRLLFALVLILGTIPLTVFGCVYDPLEVDLNTRNIYPITNNTYTIGRLGLQYDSGYFRQIFLNGVLLVPGIAAEVDPIFTASPAFGITAGNITTWNNHPGLTTGTHGVTGTIVGTSDVQSLTNKQILMNNGDAIQWKDGGGTPRSILFLGGGGFHVINPTGNGLNFNYNQAGEIYLWGANAGTGQELVLYGSSASAISPLRNSPTINLASFYWDGGASAGWEYKIYQNMISSGLIPKSQVINSINGVNILRLENNNGTARVYSDGTLDMVAHKIDDAKMLNMTDPTTLTISSGAITVTQGYHKVDTEGAAATDELDTINGGVTGDLITLAGASDTREVQITRNGNVRFQPDHMTESFGFVSPSGASGTFYTAGYYDAPASSHTLTQASTTVTYGTANSPYGARAFLVAGGAGTRNAGTVSIVVSGTSITSSGVRTAADSETIVADITTMALNSYYQTNKTWIGQITYTITPAGGATVYSATFNYGFAAFDNNDARTYTIQRLEIMGRAGANDAGFDIQILKHQATGWTYSAAAFVPGTPFLASMATDYGADSDLKANERFKYDRVLNTNINGTSGEGFLIRVVTTAAKAVEFMNCAVYTEAIVNSQHLKNSNQAMIFVYNGTNWMET